LSTIGGKFKPGRRSSQRQSTWCEAEADLVGEIIGFFKKLGDLGKILGGFWG